MSKNNFQERLRKMEDTKQRFSIRKFSIGAASVLIGLTIFGMGNETVHAAEQPAQNQNGVNKEEKAKQEVSVDPKANTAQFEKVSAVKEEKPDPTPAKEQNAQDSASTQTSQPAVDSVKQNAKKTQQVGNDKTALATTINAKKTRQVGNDKAALATTINAEKTQQAGNDKAVLATTITLNEPQSSVVEITESKATVQDKNSTTVKTAQELIDAIQKGTANTINIGANIDLGTISSYTNTNISNKRNIIIQSADGKQYTVDFSGYGFNMYSSNYGVTFKNLDLYGRSYYGIVRSAGSYTFDNVNYIGAELIYTDPGYNTTVNFDGNVTAYSVGSYTAPLNGKLRLCQGGNNQQVIQFADGKNTINFNSGSNVTLTTTNSNVVEVDKGTTTINVKNGAQVSLNPHTQIFTEQHRMRMDGIARGIASDGNTTLNIDQGGNLDINLTKNTKDWYLSGALYLNSGATINVNGNLNINSNGKPYHRSQGWDDPVYINSNATINVNGGSFKVNATNMGDDYKGSIVTSNGKIAINHHGTFDVTGDGAKATGVSLGNGSTFTSTQPELFNISMPDGATAIKNGKVQFKGVKTSTGGQPIGEIDIIYDSNGTPKVTTVTSYDKDTTTATRTAGNNAKNKINLVAAGKEVDLKGITFTKDADGNYIMSGNANTADNNGAYVYISVNGTVHQVAPTDSQTLYTVGPTGGPTSSQVPYTAETGADGEFSVNLGKLKDTDQVSLYAAKDFVTSDKDTKTVSEWMTSFYRDQLQKLVDEAPTVEGGSNYINATDSLKTAYANAISDGSAFLQNPSATSEQLEAAATAITTAKTALNGDLNKVKQDLEAAVDAAPDFENTSATYYNAASAKQQAYNTAISDGSEALKAQNPTVESLTDALNKINEAKSALDGQPTDKQALQAAVNKSKDVKDSNNYANADQNAKTAYDNAVTAAQGVLDNSNATQAQVTQALQDLNTANGKLNGDAKTEEVKQALEDAVKEAPTVEKTDSKYYNGTEKAQDDYKNTVSEGQKVLDNANATADQIKTALDNINAAKGALDGDPTNKTILQNSVDNAVDLDKSNADAQAKKDYTDALNKAKQVLAYPNATQQAVNEANAALTNAKTALDNSSVLQNAKDALQRAVDAKSTTEKTPAYYNAASAKQQAYNTAISDGSDALKAQNPTVESLTTALNKINEAKSALDGKATDTSKLKAAVDNANTVKASNDYKDASADDQKQYDDAVKAGQQLLDPTTAPSPLTQADVDRAAKAITDAQSALTTSATTNVKDAKGKATADLTNAVDAAKKAIDQDTNLTEDERNAAKAQVDSDASAAKEAINKATTNDAVTYAATAGKVTIDKTVANAAIDNAAAGRNKAIDGSSLTDEEKNGIKDQVAQAVKTAKDIISAADTEQAVTTAQKNGVAAIAGIKVPTESATKTAADKAIDEALANKQAEINKSTTLTDEEKANLNQQAQNAANTAKQNIANAKTDSAVATAQENGVAAIDGIKVSANSTAKDQAKSNITDAADKAKQTIDQDNNLTNDQKQAAKAQVDADAKTAQEAINKATTNDDVTSATNTGKLAIDKAVANAAIDNAVAGKKAEISNAKDLSSDDVKALNNEVDQAANDAKNAISSATTEKAVKTAQTDGVDKINAIDVATTAAKDKAKSDIDQTANDAKKAIDDNKDLTDDQKTAAKDQIDQDATKAKDNINNAKTDKDVEDANNAGQLAIAKDGAKAAIQGALNKKLNEIDSASALTSDEKAKLTNDANTAATNANKAIDAATTPIEVTSAQTAGIQDIENVKVPAESTTKDQAKSNITDAADKAKQTIDQDNNLTNDQKQAAKDQVDTDAKNAQDAIDNAKTDADVNNAADNGKIAIDKTVADAAIDNAVAGKIKDVKAPLTTDEQKTLTDLIKETGENAKQNIANATTPAEVTIAQDAGVNAIDQINVPTTSPVKDAADKAIDEALKNKTAAINKADNITDQEKHSLIDKVNKAADDATSAIKNATTDNAVKDAETKGLNEINGVTIPTLAEKQQAANVAIDQAAKAKKAEIAKALQAGNIDQAKADSLNTEVDNDVTNAMKAIANATTNAAVVVAQNDGIHKIKAIKVPSSTYNPDITNNTSTGSGDTDSTSTKPAEEATLKLILTHNAYIYNKDYQITYKDNKRVVLKKGTQIIALDNGKKYLIKGKEFYRIGDNQYVKVSNTISYYYLVHNSFLYNKHGKTIKRNGKRILVRKGVRLEANKVKVVKINGKKFYKVGKSTYIKFRNVKLIISPNN